MKIEPQLLRVHILKDEIEYLRKCSRVLLNVKFTQRFPHRQNVAKA